MAGRGPARIPTALKVLRGNPGHQKLNKREPQPRRGAVECPSDLDRRAKAEWKRIVPELAYMGLLTQADGRAIAGYCQAYSEWVEADLAIQAAGSLTYEAKQGIIPRPEVKIRHTAAMRMLRFAQEFGLTPSSRARIQVGSKQDEEPEDGILS